jgi:Maltose acetyltransferase hexapeptide capping motif
MGAMKERTLRGELHRPDDPELLAGQERCARLPGGVVAYGNPARVVREIGGRDRVVLP